MSDSGAAGSDGGKEANAREDSNEASAPGQKVTAVKDKKCRYCDQLFTSSSLGRHLDQYLFKKKPDGIHDVDEIRRVRSGITRRTARNSNKQASPDIAGKKPTPDPHTIPPLQLNPRGAGKGFRVFLNQPSWQATGVINDIPNSTPVSQLKIPATPLERLNQLTDSNPETARALELALREVLDSIKAATTRKSSRLSPFDFDLQSQTFPALCLQALPPPPSLFSTHPFASPSSFPIEPPTPNQRDIVQQALRAQVEQWKSDQLGSAMSTAQHTSQLPSAYSAASPSSDAEMIERTSQQHEEIMMRHLDLSLRHWMALAPHEQRNLWQLEITRAFVRETEKRKKLEQQLDRTQQEANQLRAQVEKLTSCQWPREFAIFPPNLLPLTPEVARELDDKESKLNRADASRWDYDTLVAKWKRVVMHDKSMGRSGVGAYMDPITERQHAASATRNLLQKIPNSNNNNSNRLGMPSPSQPSNPVSPESMNLDRQPGNPPTPYETRDPNDNSEPFRPAKRQRLGNHQSQPSYNGDELSTQTPPNSSNPTTRTLSNSSAHTVPPLTYSHNASSPLPPPNSAGRESHFPSHAYRPQNVPSSSPHLNSEQRLHLDHRSPAEREVSNAMVSMHHESVPQHPPLPPPPPPQKHHPYPDGNNRGMPMNINTYSRPPGGVS
ncbi:hypothetical protein D8B26_002009 [Coccidioides posadasii str. Silveira]|uniref:Uncharacterized protein n=3 Tax=Coccidioides posadasii TaxID=199306 RepID=E9CX70_COCPS|nr:hypothetical protein CPC735_052240 [Coccidioides posadasii C735 delta SOWgp]EER23854.1 hypothetical protein CPC735_052240 [Coccidioides posadasii C735 delta SOWgp]EFW21896.1 conserved hypothetical protein [Coccidioides posadasii str. Silveira]KMM65356.1 hypothetical protein CPAG_01707 [Coccidioides posadasii RMSCC 3488]QVM07308.1 hypothetical protein D8B26_002009 [Coccidioides posadasii str. Silveira]|eukprot:XP_003065999.1 hypothetical protein CPC735_052240 [Coccidioides posadasii C735 delta SOWgp]